ncbi:MAG: hypothetical protein M1820_008521 [Bogoriella megaspora]|nr:MAG: hypothetical protein M1820_008521 [Bogoriella megaspora]
MKSISPNGQVNFNVCVAMAVIATLAVGIRIGVHIRYKILMIGSDSLTVLSLAIFFGYIGVLTHYIQHKPGNGELDATKMDSMPIIIYMLKMLFVTELLFTVNITAIKLSLLMFYNKLFSIKKWFRLAIVVAGAICVAWCITFVLLLVFQCKPVDAHWNMLGSPKYCISTSQLLLGYEMTNLFLDVTILVLPMTMLRQLQMPGYRKASIGGIFLLGAFVCIASIMRLYYIYPPQPPHSSNVPQVMIWSTIQLSVAIVCSCLPTYGPLFRCMKPAVHSRQNKYQNTRKTADSQSVGASSAAHLSPSPYYKIEGDRSIAVIADQYAMDDVVVDPMTKSAAVNQRTHV